MQSISFASGGDTVRRGRAGGRRPSVCCLESWPGVPQVQQPLPPAPSPQDMTDYVAYVAKDPINQRGEAQWAVGPVESASAAEAALTLSRRPPPPSLPHPGVLRGPRPERHQHRGPSLRAALQTVPAQPPQGGRTPRKVRPRPPGARVLVSCQDSHFLICKTPMETAPAAWDAVIAVVVTRGRPALLQRARQSMCADRLSRPAPASAGAAAEGSAERWTRRPSFSNSHVLPNAALWVFS